jgi:hypothetical protein
VIRDAVQCGVVVVMSGGRGEANTCVSTTFFVGGLHHRFRPLLLSLHFYCTQPYDMTDVVGLQQVWERRE